jgi:polar amino acid transport system substrate-binding protein
VRGNPSRRKYLAVAGTAIVTGTAGCIDGTESQETSPSETGDGTNGATTTESSTDSETTPLVTGADAPFEPFVVNTEPEQLTGFDVEMLETVIETMPAYTHEQWLALDEWPDDFRDAINGGDVDVGVGAVTILDQREQEWGVRFTDPYFVINQAFFVPDGSQYQPTTPADLAGHTIGAQADTTGAGVVTDLIEEGTLDEGVLETFPHIEDAIQRIVYGSLDVGVIDHPVVQSYSEEFDIEIAFQVDTGEEYGFVVDDGRDTLLDALNDGIATVRNNDALFGGLVSEWF